MQIKRYAVVALAMSLFANAAFGAGVRMYRAEEMPDPQEVANVLSQSGLKMRSIRLIPASPDTKPAEAAPAAPAPAASYAAEEARPAVVAASAPAIKPEAPVAESSTVAAAPASPASKADDEPESFALPVQFAFDSAAILPGAFRQLDAVANGIKLARPGVKVIIEGHTDSVGSGAYNLKLSAQRAEAVRTYLITHHGLDPARLRVVGMGKLAPLNKAVPTAPENRRVEFRAEA